MESLKKILLSFLTVTLLVSCKAAPADNASTLSAADVSASPVASATVESAVIAEDGIYDSMEDVALYLETYWRLPDNYMTKTEARKQGWNGGALNQTIAGMCIGGDRYGNYEGTLPEVEGRTYFECDIDTLNSTKRGAKRMIWSTDENIYYTEDHYETFTLIYGDDAE